MSRARCCTSMADIWLRCEATRALEERLVRKAQSAKSRSTWICPNTAALRSAFTPPACHVLTSATRRASPERNPAAWPSSSGPSIGALGSRGSSSRPFLLLVEDERSAVGGDIIALGRKRTKTTAANPSLVAADGPQGRQAVRKAIMPRAVKASSRKVSLSIQTTPRQRRTGARQSRHDCRHRPRHNQQCHRHLAR
jgi:hypothetical protein